MPTHAVSRLQFAVVREDPRVESGLVHELGARRVLLVGSGGCTALHLRAACPGVAVTLVEPNPAQLAHVQRKLAALGDPATRPASAPALWNVGSAAADGLHECGNFERLFRLFRSVLDVFVVAADDRRARCADPAADWTDVVGHPYWPVAFATAFSDELLLAMFGRAAIQHAEPGSYPGYFRSRLEQGLAADDRAQNPWLHHVLLGHYLPDPRAWPPFLREPPDDVRPFDVIAGDLAAVPSFAPFDLVHLSNVLDWMDDAACRALAARLGRELRPGAAVLWRQLNDPRPLADYFAPTIRCDAAQDARWTAAERALFYDRVHVGRQQGP